MAAFIVSFAGSPSAHFYPVIRGFFLWIGFMPPFNACGKFGRVGGLPFCIPFSSTNITATDAFIVENTSFPNMAIDAWLTGKIPLKAVFLGLLSGEE